MPGFYDAIERKVRCIYKFPQSLPEKVIIIDRIH